MTQIEKKQQTFAEALMAECPRCQKPVLRVSKQCQECGSEFTKEEIAELTKDTPSSTSSCAMLMVIIVAASLLIYAVASNVSSSPDKRNIQAEKLVLEQGAKRRVQAVLRDPNSAEFSGLLARPTTQEGQGIVCGYVRSRNGFGGMNGPQRFIVTDTIFLIDEKASPDEMQRSWDILCNP
ncbi:MAG: hypothetical protein ABJ242_06365 [Marinomonas sp.]|uniref:hypothetical protein n=1 Tax=Parasphingorhabdus sp. TaxID=2709688 RepID=UPI00327765FE